MTEAELACIATWKRCAEDFDFFNEYMTEVALAGHGSGQESAKAEVRALMDAAKALLEDEWAVDGRWQALRAALDALECKFGDLPAPAPAAHATPPEILILHPTQAEEACRATWKRCAEDFDFFGEYMTEVALAGHGRGQEDGYQRGVAEAQRLAAGMMPILRKLLDMAAPAPAAHDAPAPETKERP